MVQVSEKALSELKLILSRLLIVPEEVKLEDEEFNEIGDFLLTAYAEALKLKKNE